MKNTASKPVLFLALTVPVGLVAFSLAFDGFFASDDFHTLALARHIQNPVYLFGNHFPFKLLYRPLGLIYWWLCYQLLGLHVYAYHLADFLVYTATAYLAWRVLVQLTGNTLVSGLLACLVLVHPVTASTAMWLSTRYEMLAVLFMLLSIHSAIRYIETDRWIWLFYSLLSQVLAILAKELAYITPILLTVIILTFPNNKLNTRARIGSLSLSYLVAVALIAIRYWVLGRLGHGLEGGILDLPRVLSGGYLNWLSYLPQNLLYGAGVGILGGWAKAAYVAILSVLGLGLVLAIVSGRVSRERHVAFLGVALVLSPGLVMAPVTATYPFPTIGDHYDVSVMITSRYFYASVIGLAVLVCGLTAAFLRSTSPVWRKYLTLAVVCLLSTQIGIYAATSRKIAAGSSALANGANRQVIESISRAVSSLDLDPGCKIYILNTESALPYLRNYMDVAIKAVGDGDPDVVSCYIQGETAPMYYLVPASSAREETFKPLQPRLGPDLVGNLAFLYLRGPETQKDIEAVIDDGRAVFLDLRDHTLSNVTDEVRARRRW